MIVVHHIVAAVRENLPGFSRLPNGVPPVPVIDEISRFVVRGGPDPRDAVLERCHADPAYQRWVLACLQVRLSIQADQTFPRPADRRAQIARIMAAAQERRAQMLENQPV